MLSLGIHLAEHTLPLFAIPTQVTHTNFSIWARGSSPLPQLRHQMFQPDPQKTLQTSLSYSLAYPGTSISYVAWAAHSRVFQDCIPLPNFLLLPLPQPMERETPSDACERQSDWSVVVRTLGGLREARPVSCQWPHPQPFAQLV